MLLLKFSARGFSFSPAIFIVFCISLLQFCCTWFAGGAVTAPDGVMAVSSVLPGPEGSKILVVWRSDDTAERSGARVSWRSCDLVSGCGSPVTLGSAGSVEVNGDASKLVPCTSSAISVPCCRVPKSNGSDGGVCQVKS